MPTKFLILPSDSAIKAQRASNKKTALTKAASMALLNPHTEVHLYELHTSFKAPPAIQQAAQAAEQHAPSAN
jgi:hypothetical protein